MTDQIVARNAGAAYPLPLEIAVAVDGTEHGAAICYCTGQRTSFDGPIDAAGVLHKYHFRDIRLTDEASLVTASATAVKDAGTIRVSVRRLLGVAPGAPNVVSARKAFDPEPIVFHEQSKKAQLKHSAGCAALSR